MTGQSYINYHLAISREAFNRHAYKPLPEAFKAKQVKPDYDTFTILLEGVGGPWGWTQRPRYYDNRVFWERRLHHPETRLFLLTKRDQPLGYCLAGTLKEDLSGIFAGAVTGQYVIEIENFGFFPQHTGKGYGQVFLPALLGTLLKDYDAVYLSSRSTNHAKVILFYEGLGMEVIHQETLPDDLKPAPSQRGHKPPCLALRC